MAVLAKLKNDGVREMAVNAGRGAVRSAGRGARRGAKRGFGLGAARGAGETAIKRTGRRPASGFERARDRLGGAGAALQRRGGRAREQLRGAVRDFTEAGRGASRRSRAAAVGAASAAGAAGAYFLDPQNGRRRRHVARDRAVAFGRVAAAKLRRQAEYRTGQASGVARRVRSESGPQKPAVNDQQLADRVRSELFRPADAPKGSVVISAENGIVQLRGEVENPNQKQALAKAAAGIDGVAGVENLLHMPGEPAHAHDGHGAGSSG
jgi:osmotically-inducible protein OsmY